MDLSSSEYCFQNYLLSGQDETFSALVDEIKTSVTKTQNLDVIRRMNIYLDSYRHRLQESLKKDYPKLFKLLGDQAFTKLAGQYIKEFPSKYFSLTHIGQHLCDFLNHTTPYSEQPYLAEMASFEYSLHEILQAQDFLSLERQAFDKLPLNRFADIKLRFTSTLKILNLKYDVPCLWQEIEDNQGERVPKLYSNPRSFLISRKNLQGRFRSIEPSELFALDQMSAGKNFAELCQALTCILEEHAIPAFTVNCLNQWFNDGLIIEIIYET